MVPPATVLVVVPVNGDNPQASEIMNHLGPSSKMFCQICVVSYVYGEATPTHSVS